MARSYPRRHYPVHADVTDPRAHIGPDTSPLDAHPFGDAAPYANPNAPGPVDRPVVGSWTTSCGSRVAHLRAIATRQLDPIEKTLPELRQARPPHGGYEPGPPTCAGGPHVSA